MKNVIADNISMSGSDTFAFIQCNDIKFALFGLVILLMSNKDVFFVSNVWQTSYNGSLVVSLGLFLEITYVFD